MMGERLLKRAELLLTQGRYDEVEKLLYQYLDEHADDERGQYLMAIAFLYQNKLDECRQIILSLCSHDPYNVSYFRTLIELDIKSDMYETAEENMKILLSKYPDVSDHYALMARIKFSQRNYDETIHFADKALELDAENLTALNFKVISAAAIGDNSLADKTISDALQVNPNDAYTITTYGMNFLKDGKVKEALKQFSHALSIDPRNELARHGMKEGLKAKFLPYRLLLRFMFYLTRFGGANVWAIIIGSYLVVRLFQYLAENNPSLRIVLIPLIAVIVFIFIMTWILDPLLNLYLMTNKYGKLLLDEEDRIMARLTGVTLIISAVFGILYLTGFDDSLLMYCIFFFAMMIPLGSMFTPVSEKQKQKLQLFTFGIFAFGIFGLISGMMLFFNIAVIGIIVYQFVLNAMTIKRSSRTFD